MKRFLLPQIFTEHSLLIIFEIRNVYVGLKG